MNSYDEASEAVRQAYRAWEAAQEQWVQSSDKDEEELGANLDDAKAKLSEAHHRQDAAAQECGMAPQRVRVSGT